MVIPEKSVKKEVLHILSEHIVYIQKPKKTATDRMAEWLTELMPTEESQAPSSKPEAQIPSHQTFVPSE